MTKITTETTEPQAAQEPRKPTKRTTKAKAKPEPKDAPSGQENAADATPDTKPAKKTKAAKGGTLRDVAEGYLASMEQAGKSEGTCFSYRMELRLALEAIGEETPVAKIAVADVAAFFASDPVNKTRSGLPKSPLSVAKTQRVLRQALTYAVAEGLIEKAPLPEKA